MLMQSHDQLVLTGGLAEQSAFGFELNGMAFDAVINGLYADKIRSPMRELASNAFDAHVVAGCPERPFDITLPSALNPIFEVRDYGLSMSHPEVMGLYSTMFSSTKRASNLVLGQKGLGSKSAFAYTSVFSVTTYRDGVCRHYSAFLGEEGVPQIALLETSSSNQENGTCVSFSVDIKDVDTFRRCANDVFFGFDPRPNIANETFIWDSAQVLYEGDGWKAYVAGTVPFTKLMARQGPVLYPLDAAPLQLTRPEPLFNWPIVIDFPIGELSVSTSREALGYDQRTKANILKRIEETRTKMTTLVEDEINAAKSWIEACTVLQQGRSAGGTKGALYTLLENALTYNGKALVRTFHLPKNGNGFLIHQMDANSVEMGVLKHHVSFRPSSYISTYSAMELWKGVQIYHESPECTMGPSRMRTVLKENVDRKHIVWVRGDITTIKSMVGDKEIIDLSTITPTKVPSPQAKSPGMTQILRYVDGRSRYDSWNDKKARYDEVTLGPAVVYIEQRGADFFPWPDGGVETYWSVHNQVHALKKDGLLDANQKFYFVPKSATRILESVQLTTFSDHVKSRIPAFIKSIDLKSEEAESLSYNDRDKASRLRQFITQNPTIPVPKEVIAWVDRVEELLAASKDKKVLESSTKAVLNRFAPEVLEDKPQGTNTLASRTRIVNDKYPLLFNLVSYGMQQVHLGHYLELLAK